MTNILSPRTASRARFLPAAAAVLLAYALATAAPDAAGIYRKLDRPIDLDIQDAPVKDVFEQIAAETGIPFVIAPRALELLPYGEQTRVAVRVPGVPLRKALAPMLAPQGLDWSVTEDGIRIQPSEPLARMGRRASYEELQVLGAMLSARLLPPAEAGKSVMAQLREAADAPNLDLVFEVAGDEPAAIERADEALPATAADWLDAMCRQQLWSWYLSGREIRVIPQAQQIRRQLQRRVSCQYENAELVNVLHELALEARVKLEMEPAVLEELSESVRRDFSLRIADATVEQALEVIRGSTGLKFEVTDTGVRVSASQALREKNGARPRTPFFVLMTLPDTGEGEVQVFLRGNELPEDVQALILAERDRMVEGLRRRAAETVEPATRPAEPPSQ
jgi:hypothetical protein